MSLTMVTPRLTRRMQRALINRNFALLLAGASAAGITGWMWEVAIGWVVLDLSGSAATLGLFYFAMTAPTAPLSLWGGIIADRWPRRPIVMTHFLVVTAITATLAAAASLGVLSIPLLIVCAAGYGIFEGLFAPAWWVFIRDLVGPERLRSAIAINATRFNLTRVIGPLLGGLVLANAGAVWCLWAAVLGDLAFVVAAAFMRPPPTPAPAPATAGPAAIGEGLRLARHTPSLRRPLLAALVIGLAAMPIGALLPTIARDRLGQGPEVLGLLTAMIGAGAVVGALASGSRPVTTRPGWTMALLLLAEALSLFVLAASAELSLVLAALALHGCAMVGFLALANASMQLAAPPALVGRVVSLWVATTAAAFPVGSLVQGWSIERWGLPPTFAVAGLLCLATCLWLALGARRASTAQANQPSPAPSGQE